jgi:uncharacterized ferredoxin-like protein
MKLYATITSERASKGQGGNEYIEIELLVGTKNKQKKAGIVLMEPSYYGFEVRYIPPAGISKSDSILLSEIKGERQKGEQCEACRAGYCEDHGTIPM